MPLEAAPFQHPGSLHTQAQLTRVAARIRAGESPASPAYLNSFLPELEKALTETPSATAEFNVPGFYDDPEGHRAAKRALEDDSRAAYALGLAYHLVDDPSVRIKAADKAVALLMAWADCKLVSGYDGQLVMSYLGTTLITAADLVYAYPGWKSGDRARFLEFTRMVFKPASSIKSRTNNWGDWGLFASLSAAHLLEDSAGFYSDIEAVKKKIGEGIAADGSMPLETARGDRGLWYTYFALAPLTAAGQVALNHSGIDLFKYTAANGRTIKKALEYLFPFARNPASWPFGAQVNIPTASSWPGNLFEAMAERYQVKEWEAWVAPARPVVGPITHHGWNFPTLLQASSQPTSIPCPPGTCVQGRTGVEGGAYQTGKASGMGSAIDMISGPRCLCFSRTEGDRTFMYGLSGKWMKGR